MLKIFQPPESFSFGLEDRFNGKMVKSLNDCGVHCTAKRLWPDFWARHLFFADLPYLYLLFRHVVAPLSCWTHLSEIEADDVVWINGPSLPIFDADCWFERQVIRRGASYVFWIEDDWFSEPKKRPSAEVRMQLAHLVVTVTPILRDRISRLYPDKSVILLEEPIDVERLTPTEAPKDQPKPLILVGGRPWSLKKLLMLDGVLKRVYQDLPFTLRVITGIKKPELALTIPWEWLPYDRWKEAEYAAGAIAGLAPLEDTLFNSCKGNYKVKTYMALGVPPLTSSIGYNNHLIKHGETGFLLNSEMEWESVLRTLLKDASLAAKIGKSARLDIIKRYSYEALMPIWAEALQRAFPAKLLT